MQARNLTTNVPKILDLKSSSEQIFFKNCRWVPLCNDRLRRCPYDKGNNGLFAAGHSCGTKPPSWRARDALAQDKQSKLPL